MGRLPCLDDLLRPQRPRQVAKKSRGSRSDVLLSHPSSNVRKEKRMRMKFWFGSVALLACFLTGPTRAGEFFFSTGIPDGKMATASRPSSAGKIEIESADDFVLTSPTNITSATFTGLLPTGAPLTDVVNVRVEIYRVFPKDSTDPPKNPNAVPTRVNSPSDEAFDERGSATATCCPPRGSSPHPSRRSTRSSTGSIPAPTSTPVATAPSRGRRSRSTWSSRRRSTYPPITTSSCPRCS